MSSPVVLGLVATVVVTVLAWVLPLPDPGASSGGQPAPRRADHGLRLALVALSPALLGTTAVLALTTTGDGSPRTLGLVLVVLAAAIGGGPLTAAVLRLAPPEPVPVGSPPAAPPATVLRGGATIGVLERGAICVAVLTGWPEGIAIVLAVKGLGRYPELRAAAGTSERFIIGTFTSVLWSLACAGTAVLGVLS